MINCAINLFSIFLILCHEEYVKSYTFEIGLRTCLDTISRDFGWERKKNLSIKKTITNLALKERSINDMHNMSSTSYFEYMRSEINLDNTNIETPIQFCQNNTRYIPRSMQIEIPYQPPGRVYYLTVAECLNEIAEYFLCTGNGILGCILSDNMLEIAKDLFTHRKESEFDLLDKTHNARKYYHKIISHIKFNDSMMEPKAFCLSIGSNLENIEIEFESLKDYYKRQKASSSRPNNPWGADSSSEEEN